MITKANEDDIPHVINLCFERAKEFDFRTFPKPDIKAIADTVVGHWQNHPCFVFKQNGEVIGFVGLTQDTFWWSKEPILTDYMVYALPGKRNIEVASALYDAAKSYADEKGMVLALYYIAIDRIEARQRLMRRMGFEVSGFSAIYKGVKNGR